MTSAPLRRTLLVLPALLALASLASSHQGETSRTDIEISSRAVTTTVHLEVGMLQRLVELDVDRNGETDWSELAASYGAIQRYLAEHLLLSLDEGPPSLGVAAPPEHPDETLRRNSQVAFRFVRPIEREPDLVTLVYDVWVELGPAHMNVTELRRTGEEPLEIAFTEAEPDYDYFREPEPSWLRRTAHQVGLAVERLILAVDRLLFRESSPG